MWQRSACWLALVVAACAGPSSRNTAASDAAQAAGAEIRAYPADLRTRTGVRLPFSSRESLQVNGTGADASGRYEMVLPPTVVRLYAHAAGGEQEVWWDGESSWSAASAVDMSPGDRVIDIRLAAR